MERDGASGKLASRKGWDSLRAMGARIIAAAAWLSLGAAAAAQPLPTLQQRVEARLREAGPGPRFGLLVTAEDGRALVSIDPDGRFIPASNTKMFTTAAAFATMPALDRPDAEAGAAVRLDSARPGAPDVVLEGHGDARLSSADDCTVDCLSALADAVAAKARVVHDVIGDDTIFPDERWSPGMSWNNIPTRSGTGISALTLDDNELPVTVAPGAIGKAPLPSGLPYYTIDNRAVTVAGAASDLSFDRMPDGMVVRLSGTIGAEAPPELLRLGIDDPAHYAAWRLAALLKARGVRVTGAIGVRHRPLTAADDPAHRGSAPAARPPVQPVLARVVPAPLAEDLIRINKASQNLHAELLLRRLGRIEGSGSIADGLVVVRRVAEQAGLPQAAWDLSDGSGMSTYNRVAPRGAVLLLRWIAGQPWGALFRATLPVGGVDGTLAKRFGGSLLSGKLFAKTGTLNATNALSGYLTAASGRTLIFSSYANDVPANVAATRAVDAALQMIAAEN